MATRVGLRGGQRVVAVHGETPRAARTATGASHLVAAFDHAAGAVVGQPAVTARSNEIPGLRALLDRMDVIGSVMRCQRETAAHIINRGAHYVLTVKETQPTPRLVQRPAC